MTTVSGNSSCLPFPVFRGPCRVRGFALLWSHRRVRPGGWRGRRRCPVLAFYTRASSDAADATFVGSAQTPLGMRPWYPPLRPSSGQALRQEREGRGTHCPGGASRFESLGHPPLEPFDKFGYIVVRACFVRHLHMRFDHIVDIWPSGRSSKFAPSPPETAFPISSQRRNLSLMRRIETL